MRAIYFFIALSLPVQCPQTTKNREMLYSDGFEYKKKGQSKDGETQFWSCVRSTCNGRVHTPVGLLQPANIVTGHNHPRVEAAHEARVAKEGMKGMARQHLEAHPRNIIAQERVTLSDEARMLLPSTSTLQRSIERQREAPERQGVDAAELANIIIDGAYRNDILGNRFLLFDSRETEPNNVIFFVYATDDGLRRLRTYRNWASDGTFKIAPGNMLQIYTINSIIEHSSVPAVFVLMSNKAQATYNRVLQILNARIGIGPTSVMLDFEMAAKNAYTHVFGENLQIRFCLFHLGQAINRRLKTGKLSHYYATNNEYKILVRSLAALSFLEEIRVVPAFNLLRQRANELGIQAVPNAGQPVAIFDYFGRNYVNGHDGRPPLFPVHTWNHHDSVLQDLGRTNNAQEGFHLALRMQFNSVHPPLSK